MSHSKWYYQLLGEEFGPVSWELLVELSARQQLAPTDLIRSEQQAEWQQAGQVAALFPAGPAFDSVLKLAPTFVDLSSWIIDEGRSIIDLAPTAEGESASIKFVAPQGTPESVTDAEAIRSRNLNAVDIGNLLDTAETADQPEMADPTVSPPAASLGAVPVSSNADARDNAPALDAPALADDTATTPPADALSAETIAASPVVTAAGQPTARPQPGQGRVGGYAVRQQSSRKKLWLGFVFGGCAGILVGLAIFGLQAGHSPPSAAAIQLDEEAYNFYVVEWTQLQSLRDAPTTPEQWDAFDRSFRTASEELCDRIRKSPSSNERRRELVLGCGTTDFPKLIDAIRHDPESKSTQAAAFSFQRKLDEIRRLARLKS